MHLFTESTVKDILCSNYLFKEFDVEAIKEAANSLTPENCLIYLLAPSFPNVKETSFLTEKLYGTQYTK